MLVHPRELLSSLATPTRLCAERRVYGVRLPATVRPVRRERRYQQLLAAPSRPGFATTLPYPAMPRSPSAQIAFARLSMRDEGNTPSLFGSPTESALLDSLVPGTRITRYGRIWRMAQYRRENELVQGRIGFETESSVEQWNESTKDFSAQTMTAGRTSPFAIDVGTSRVAFQLRGATIRTTTFTENLRALMDVSSVYKWSVEPEHEVLPWDEWLTSVELVTELNIRLRPANPHGDFDDIQAILVDTNAAALNIIAKSKAESPQGIKIDDAFIAHALGHARQGYGSYKAKGQTPAGQITKWDPRGEGKPVSVRQGIDPATKEIQGQSIADELRRHQEHDG